MEKKLDTATLKRKPKDVPVVDEELASQPVSAGAIGLIVDLVGNPSRDKIREVTSIDRTQGRLLPQLDVVGLMWGYLFEISLYRTDPEKYKVAFKRDQPQPPNPIEEFIFRTAQWQKSVNAMNLKSLMDLALAETERGGEGEEDIGGRDVWKE